MLQIRGDLIELLTLTQMVNLAIHYRITSHRLRVCLRNTQALLLRGSKLKKGEMMLTFLYLKLPGYPLPFSLILKPYIRLRLQGQCSVSDSRHSIARLTITQMDTSPLPLNQTVHPNKCPGDPCSRVRLATWRPARQWRQVKAVAPRSTPSHYQHEYQGIIHDMAPGARVSCTQGVLSLGLLE